VGLLFTWLLAGLAGDRSALFGGERFSARNFPFGMVPRYYLPVSIERESKDDVMGLLSVWPLALER